MTDPGAHVSRETAVATAFGNRASLAHRYADLLAGAGVERGLLGPREVPRLWDRHLLNCAALAPLIPVGDHVIDVGSGAGLPGVVLAIARPDLRVTLVEPLQRRAAFLEEIIEALSLTGCTVRRERAEDSPVSAATVTARAVAPLGRLVSWCLPLVQPAGQLLAIKGRAAEEELSATESQLRRAGAVHWEVLVIGTELGAPTNAVQIRVGPDRPSLRRMTR